MQASRQLEHQKNYMLQISRLSRPGAEDSTLIK